MKRNLWFIVMVASLFIGWGLMALGTVSLIKENVTCPVCLYDCPQLTYPLEVAELLETMDGSVAIGEDIDTHVGDDLVEAPKQ